MFGDLIELFTKISMHRAGLKKRYVLIDDGNGASMICYAEKGSKIAEQPSIVFIHGFSSDKSTWLGIIKGIPDNFHCIAIDMPGHGESIGFHEEDFIVDKIVDKIKMFFDKLNLIEPMCFVGTSIGATIVSIFATKYPSYVSMICLLAPIPPGEEYQTKILEELRSGSYQMVLPETTKELFAAADAMSMKKVGLRRILAKQYLKWKSSTLDQNKTILKSAFENEYPNLEESYKHLENLRCPVLIIWGRQDQLCTPKGADYFANIIPNAKLIIFDNCGHLIPKDKPIETTHSIIDFWKIHHSDLTRL